MCLPWLDVAWRPLLDLADCIGRSNRNRLMMRVQLLEVEKCKDKYIGIIIELLYIQLT